MRVMGAANYLLAVALATVLTAVRIVYAPWVRPPSPPPGLHPCSASSTPRGYAPPPHHHHHLAPACLAPASPALRPRVRHTHGPTPCE